MKFLLNYIMIFAIITEIYSEKNKINESNWLNHDDIKEIRKIFNDCEKIIDKNKIKPNFKSIEENNLEIKKYLYFNKNIPIKFTQEYGTEDSFIRSNSYYDSKGKLRFVFIVWNSVSGGKAEYRIYLNSNQNIIYQDRKIIDERWSFPDSMDKNSLFFDPIFSFNEI